MSAPSTVAPSGTRVALLAGQGFALGLTLSWVLIPASAIFLTAYGSEPLPLTYIASAAAGIVASSVLARAFSSPSAPSRRTDDADRDDGHPPRRVRHPVGLGRALGLVRPAHPRPDHRAGRVHLHRRPGGNAARRTRAQGLVRPGGGGVRPGVGRRWCERRTAPRRARRHPGSPRGRGGGGRGVARAGRGDSAPIPGRAVRRRATRAFDGASQPPHARREPVRPADRGVPDALGHREPVAGLSRLREVRPTATTAARRSHGSSAASPPSRTASTSCSSSCWQAGYSVASVCASG